MWNQLWFKSRFCKVAKTCTQKPTNTAPMVYVGAGAQIYCLASLKQESWIACSVATCYFDHCCLTMQLSDNSHNVGSMWIIKLISPQQVAISDRSIPNNQLYFAERIMHHNGPVHILATLIYLWFINNCSLEPKYLFRGIVTNLFWTTMTLLYWQL